METHSSAESPCLNGVKEPPALEIARYSIDSESGENCCAVEGESPWIKRQESQSTCNCSKGRPSSCHGSEGCQSSRHCIDGGQSFCSCIESVSSCCGDRSVGKGRLKGMNPGADNVELKYLTKCPDKLQQRIINVASNSTNLGQALNMTSIRTSLDDGTLTWASGGTSGDVIGCTSNDGTAIAEGVEPIEVRYLRLLSFDYLVCSILLTFFVPIFGIPALVCAIRARHYLFLYDTPTRSVPCSLSTTYSTRTSTSNASASPSSSFCPCLSLSSPCSPTLCSPCNSSSSSSASYVSPSSHSPSSPSRPLLLAAARRDSDHSFRLILVGGLTLCVLMLACTLLAVRLHRASFLNEVRLAFINASTVEVIVTNDGELQSLENGARGKTEDVVRVALDKKSHLASLQHMFEKSNQTIWHRPTLGRNLNVSSVQPLDPTPGEGSMGQEGRGGGGEQVGGRQEGGRHGGGRQEGGRQEGGRQQGFDPRQAFDMMLDRIDRVLPEQTSEDERPTKS